jgi:hypothetical protein
MLEEAGEFPVLANEVIKRFLNHLLESKVEHTLVIHSINQVSGPLRTGFSE